MRSDAVNTRNSAVSCPGGTSGRGTRSAPRNDLFLLQVPPDQRDPGLPQLPPSVGEARLRLTARGARLGPRGRRASPGPSGWAWQPPVGGGTSSVSPRVVGSGSVRSGPAPLPFPPGSSVRDSLQ